MFFFRNDIFIPISIHGNISIMQPYSIHPDLLFNALSVEEKTALGGVILPQNEFKKKCRMES